MGQEIERKFLVTSGDYKAAAAKATYIKQGYLSSVPGRTVRIRIKGDKGIITIKGIGDASGASRFEWEKKMPVIEAEELLKICEPGVIEKTRYLVEVGNHTFEVDEFHGENEGLVVAEVELKSKDEQVEKPAWLGTEVTGDKRYYNAMLMKNPSTRW